MGDFPLVFLSNIWYFRYNSCVHRPRAAVNTGYQHSGRGPSHENIHQGPLRPAPDGGHRPAEAGGAGVPPGRRPAAGAQRQIPGADRHPPGPGGAGALGAGGRGRLPAHPEAGGVHRGRHTPPPGGGSGPGGVRHRRGLVRPERGLPDGGAVAGDPPGGVRRGGRHHPGRPAV